jgi:anti-anti-sigma regulatory factor
VGATGAAVLSAVGDPVFGESEAAFKKETARLLGDGRVVLVIDCARARIAESSGLDAIVRALASF